jgi:SPP1 family predicted phage head-tail adaptor
MIATGLKDKRIALEDPGDPTPDPDGGYMPGTVPLDPPEVFARIEPATGRDAERLAAGTVLTTRTHIVTIDYHPGVSNATRIRYHDFRANRDRVFQVTAVLNPGEAGRELQLVADETTAA